jgi:predicted nucleic acid-binding protein
MQSFVLDVSPCLPCCCEDEQTPFSDRLLEWAAAGSELHVPSVWPFEIVNSLAQAVRRKRIPPEQAKEFLELLKTFEFHIDPAPATNELLRLSELAAHHQLTAYDAAYLDLAIRLGLPLATRDDALRKAAVASRVQLIEA